LAGCSKVSPRAFSSPAPTLSAFPHSRGAPALVPLLWPPLAPLQQVQVCPVLRAPELDAGLPGGCTRAEQRGRIPCLDLLPTLLGVQPRVQLASWAASAHCWVMSSFLSTSRPKSFSSGLLSIHSLPSLYLYLGLPQPRCRTLHLALLNLMRLTQAHLSSLSRSLWMASLPSSMSATSRSLVLSANMLRVPSVPLRMSLTSC